MQQLTIYLIHLRNSKKSRPCFYFLGLLRRTQAKGQRLRMVGSQLKLCNEGKAYTKHIS